MPAASTTPAGCGSDPTATSNVATGAAGQGRLAQDDGSLNGKVLR